MSSLTPYRRWQKRTQNGRKLSGGWTSAQHTPTKEGRYEVRGNPKYRILTWAHGSWWCMDDGDNGIPYWHYVSDGGLGFKYDGPAAHIHWPDLLFKAVKRGSQSADRELRKLGWKGDWLP